MTSNMPSNYSYKLPAMAAGAAMIPPTPTPPSIVGGGASGYYWVCLRRPANLFVPVGPTNPMVVVDSARFPYLDGTGKLVANPTAGGPTPIPSIVRNGSLTTVANYPYSVQRYQPYRGGHAVPAAAPIGSTLVGAGRRNSDRFPLRVHRADRGARDRLAGDGHAGALFRPPVPADDLLGPRTIYHTLGWANEYEQGSLNSWPSPGTTSCSTIAISRAWPSCCWCRAARRGSSPSSSSSCSPSYGSITNDLRRGRSQPASPDWGAAGDHSGAAGRDTVPATSGSGGGGGPAVQQGR